MGAIANEVFLGTATAYLALKDQGFFDGVNQAQSALQNFSGSVDTGMSSMEKFSLSTGKIGMSLTRNVTTPVVAAGKSIIDAFRSTEDAFIGVQKTLDTTAMVKSFKLLNDSEAELTKGYDILKKAIWDMTQETGSSYETIASVMEMAGQLNVGLGENGQGIIDFTKNIIMLNDTTDLMGADAAKILAQLTHLLGTSEKEFGKLGATIVDLGNNTATTEADIVSMSQRLAGAGSTIGLTEPEILALAATLTSVGISAEMGGSAFSKAMKKMQVAAETGYEPIIQLQEKTGMSLRELELLSENDSKSFTDLAQSLGMTKTELKNMIKSGVQLQNFADIAGMSAEEFATTWKSKPIDAIERFIVGLSNTEDQGKSTIQMLQDMGFTEVRLSDVLSRMALTQDDFTENLTRANKAWNDGNALEAEAEKRYAGLNAQLSQLNEEWKLFRVELAEFVIPILKEMMGVAREVIGFLRELPDPIKKAFVEIAARAALIGPVLLGLSRITEVIINMKTLFGPVFSAISSLGKPIISAIKNIPSLITGIIGTVKGIATAIAPAFQAIAGVASIIAGPFILIKNFIDQMINGANAADSAWQILGGTIAGIGLALLGIIEWPAVLVAAAVGAAAAIVSAIIGSWDQIKEGWDTFKEGFITSIKEQWDKFWQGFKDIPKKVIEHIVDPIKKALEDGFQLEDLLSIGKALIDGLFEGIKFAITHFNVLFWLWDFVVKPIVDGVKELLGIHSPSTVFMEIGQNIVEGLFEGIKGLWEKIVTFFQEAFNNLIEWFKGLFGTITSTIASAWDSVVSGLKTIYDNAKNWFNDVKEKVKRWFDDVKENVTNKLKEIWEGMSGWFKEVWDGISGWFREVFEGIANFFSDLVGKISGWFSDIGSAIRDAFEGIKGIIEGVINFVSNAFNSFLEFIKGIFETVIGFISGAIENLKTILENVGNAISGFFENLINGIKQIWETVTSFIGQVFENIFKFVKEKIESLWKWISELPGKFMEIGGNIVKNILDGMKKAWENVTNWFQEKIEWIKNSFQGVKDFFGGIGDAISSILPGHANGLDYVPYDNYVARLHKGERVLTKEENEEYTRGSNNTGGDVFNFYNTQPDPYEYARQMKRAKKELLYT